MSRTRQRRRPGRARDHRSSVAGRRSSGRAHAAGPVAILALVESSAREVVLVHDDTRLPRELLWLYLVAPWVAAPMLDTQLLTRPFGEALRVIASMYVPFLGTPAAVHAAYAWLMPSLLRRARTRSARYAVHAVVCTLTAVGASIVLHPAHAVLCINEIPLVPFVLKSVAFTWTFMFPTLVVQGLRTRAANIERLAHAERQAALEAQLQAIQARTNPHFFFNSINTVASLIPEDPRLAEETLLRVADILRYALASSKTRFVTLERELAVVRDYLEVQRARFGDRLEFTIDIDPAALSLEVPPLVLQPLVENAILHGVAQSPRGGRVYVRATCEPGRLRLVVEDDGPGTSQHHGTGTSMADLERRLSLIYGEAGELVAGPQPSGGWRTALGLPQPAAA
jgi:two-component system sensor histidine kinase AlgZ